MYLQQRFNRISRVGTDDEGGAAAALHYSLLQFISPNVFTGLEDIIAVTDHCYGTGGELFQEVFVCLLLSGPTPRDDGATREIH